MSRPRKTTIIIVCLLPACSFARDLIVSDENGMQAALRNAADGDRVLLEPGVYQGGFFQAGLRGVTISSLDLTNLAVIEGGTNSIQLSDASRVTIENLRLRGQTGNGINIDDGGSFETPSKDIAIRNLIIENIATSGNRDGIKMSGVDGFVIDQVKVLNWGDGGSAVDLVGAHNGIVQNSLFRHESISAGGSGLRGKGGAKNVAFLANRIELPNGRGRAIQAGGSTDPQFFRFVDGDSGYEANSINAAGNIVIGGSSAFSYVNIDGGVFHHNYVHRPFDWVMRILNENQGNEIVDTRNGDFSHNVVSFFDSASEFKTTVNIGPETHANTFRFRGNQWFNELDPRNSQPNLPAFEGGSIVGFAPDFSSSDVIPWEFNWGTWFVNANESPGVFSFERNGPLLIAEPGINSEFLPLENNPFQGDWVFAPYDASELHLAPFSQKYLTTLTLLGDFDKDGLLGLEDINRLLDHVRLGNNVSEFDLDRDGIVGRSDIVVWIEDLKWSYVGDANLDGEFNSSDLVAVFQAGEYDDDVVANSTWNTGDWTGDGEFDSSDFVAAFQRGYEQGRRTGAATVPEPQAMSLVLLALWVFFQ